MAYSTQTDVAAEFKKMTFGAASPISDTDVTEFISQTDALINARVGLRYAVPVTAGADALKVLKLVSIGLTVQRVRDILEVKTGQAQSDQDVKRADIGAMAAKILDGIVKGAVLLDGATVLSSGQGFKSFNVDDGIEHNFKRDADQW